MTITPPREIDEMLLICDGPGPASVDIVISVPGGGVSVAQGVMRHLEQDVAEKLKKRAKRHARSMEDEVRHILRTAVQERPESLQKLGTRIAQRFRRSGLTSDFPEVRGVSARAADFDS